MLLINETRLLFIVCRLQVKPWQWPLCDPHFNEQNQAPLDCFVK